MKVVKLMSDDGAPSLARRVSVRREELGLTMRGLADAAGIAPSTVARIERGEVESPHCTHALARALRVESNWLLAGDVADHALSDEAIEVAIHWRMLPEPYRSSLKCLVHRLSVAGTGPAIARPGCTALSDSSSPQCAAV